MFLPFDHPPVLLMLIVGAVVVRAMMKQCGVGHHAPPTPRVCPACGTSHPPFARFCRNCGQKL